MEPVLWTENGNKRVMNIIILTVLSSEIIYSLYMHGVCCPGHWYLYITK